VVAARSQTKAATPQAKRKKKSKSAGGRPPPPAVVVEEAKARRPTTTGSARPTSRRLVTARQRQELYSLNLLMTRLEKEAFTKVCEEKGYSET